MSLNYLQELYENSKSFSNEDIVFHVEKRKNDLQKEHGKYFEQEKEK